MRSLREQLQREVASLYLFVDSISRTCTPPPQAVSYPESSTKFFEHISQLAELTKKHITDFDNHAGDSAEEFSEARTELLTLRSAWRELHRFIKSSADADTLNQPTAMVSVLVGRLRKLKGFESTDFAIFHRDVFGYAQVNPSETEEFFTQLGRIIDARPGFPPDVGLVGIPNSQGSTLFLNSLLAHEIGEYVYAKKHIEKIIAPEVEHALAERFGPEFVKHPLRIWTGFTQRVVLWAKEIFCDLFAVRLIGPCYVFAYTELFDLQNLLTQDGGLNTDIDVQPQLRSYPSHPSHPLRAKLQAELLAQDGWWELTKGVDSRVCRVLEALLEVNLTVFVEAEEAAGEPAPQLRALFDVLPAVRTEVVRVTDGIDLHLPEYAEFWKVVAEYLRNGIVPSSLNVADQDEVMHQIHPSPIALLNAAYRFYLEGVEGLMSKIKDQDSASAHTRMVWMKRIESWTAKALEDVAYLGNSIP